MSLLPFSFFPRSSFNMDRWLHPTNMGMDTLDWFDPFDQLDNVLARNMQWLNKPEFMMPSVPKYPQKYRITLDCAGYKPESIKTEINGKVLTVWGKEEVKDKDDFMVKQFKKTYTLPERAQPEKLVSFLTNEGQLCIECPLVETKMHMNQDLFPQVCEENGKKAIKMSFGLPENIPGEKIHVSIKDRDLIVKAEDKYEKPDGVSKFYYYKRTTLPENTDFTNLKCTMKDHQLEICAPLALEYKSHKPIPVKVEYANVPVTGGETKMVQ